MTDDPEARAIAAKLTRAQCEAMLWLPESPHQARLWAPRLKWQPRSNTLWLLAYDSELAVAVVASQRTRDAWWWCATHRGLRVRAALAEMEGEG